jgi:hypothetical protein
MIVVDALTAGFFFLARMMTARKAALRSTSPTTDLGAPRDTGRDRKQEDHDHGRCFVDCELLLLGENDDSPKGRAALRSTSLPTTVPGARRAGAPRGTGVNSATPSACLGCPAVWGARRLRG